MCDCFGSSAIDPSFPCVAGSRPPVSQPQLPKFSARLRSRCPHRDVILHPIKRRGSVQKSLRPKMRFQLRQQRIALSFARAFHSHAALSVRRASRRRTKLRTGQSAQPRQRRPTQLIEHFPQRILAFCVSPRNPQQMRRTRALCRSRLQPRLTQSVDQRALAPDFVNGSDRAHTSDSPKTMHNPQAFSTSLASRDSAQCTISAKVFFRIPHPPIMKPGMPNRKWLRLLDSDSMGGTAFNHLHGFLKVVVSPGVSSTCKCSGINTNACSL